MIAALALVTLASVLAAGKAPSFRQPTELGGMSALGLKLAEEIRRLVHAAGDTPRGRRTGLSAVGISGGWHPCFAFLLRHLLELPKVNSGGDRWASVVGTVLHAFFARLMARDPSRWIVDASVVLGGILHGTLDGIHRPTRTLFDLKVTSSDRCKDLKAGEPPTFQQIGQVNAYAVAWNQEHPDDPVEHVALIFLPRAFDLRHLYVWTSPVDEALVAKGLDRIVLAHDYADELGLWDDDAAVDAALPEVPITPGKACLFCPFFAPELDRASRWGCPGKEAA